MKIEVDLDEVAQQEIAKRDRRIKKLDEANRGLAEDNDRMRKQLGLMKKAKDALLEAADWLEPYRYDDDL